MFVIEIEVGMYRSRPPQISFVVKQLVVKRKRAIQQYLVVRKRSSIFAFGNCF